MVLLTKNMKISLPPVVPILTLLVLACTATQKDFEYIGEWSNVVVSKSEDPHADGFSLKLWRHQGKPIGFLTEYVGPPFDPPFGPLQDVTLNENSGEFAFSAKLSPGIVFLPGQPKGVPTQILYVFKGKLGDSDVTGTLERQDRLRNGVAERMEITLKRDRNSDWSHTPFKEWEEFFAPILKARGPKW